MQVEIAPAASDDLERILSYSLREHGQRAADTYLAAFHARLELLRDHPEAGERAIGLSSLLRRISFKKHTIYYEVAPDKVLIQRILHQAMDVGAWL